MSKNALILRKLTGPAVSMAIVVAAAAAVLGPAPASAVSAPLSDARIARHFDLTKGQTPENIALAPDGSAYVTFAAARQIARLSPRARPGSWPPCPRPPTAGSTPRPWASR